MNGMTPGHYLNFSGIFGGTEIVQDKFCCQPDVLWHLIGQSVEGQKAEVLHLPHRYGTSSHLLLQ